MSHLRRQPPIEVLEMIFARLSSRTVFKSVRLVCKQWYLASQWYLVQNLVWNDNRYAKSKSYFTDWKNLEDVLSGLFNFNNRPCPTRLVWTSNGDMTTWSQLVVALARLDQDYEEQQKVQGQNPGIQPSPLQQPKRVVPLKELVLTGECLFKLRFSLIAPYLKLLTSLRLHIHNTLEVNMDLDSILFKTCPALVRLYVRGGARLVWLSSDSATQEVRQCREASKFRLCLQSLVLQSVQMRQVPLEHYLSMSPHLDELRLIGLDMDGRRSPDWRSKFLSHVQQCTFAPQLTSFHLSFTGFPLDRPESLTVAEIQGLLDFGSEPTGPTSPQTTVATSSKSWLSKVTDWGFALNDIKPAFESLFKIRNLVTTLTLLTPSFNSSTSVLSGLHDYLCASPLLLHLYTDNIVFKVGSLDPYAAQHRRKDMVEARRWNGTNAEYDTLMEPRGIWACRNLKTLHAQFSHDQLCYYPGSSSHKDMSHAHSRVIFGYLAKVCPNLEELHIVVPPVKLSLQSGVCLLSRLKRLERFEIAMSAPILFWPLERHAWDWMATRKTRLQAWFRAGELVLWDSEIREEEWQLREGSMKLEEELSRVRLEAGLSRPAGERDGDAPVEVPRLATDSIESHDSFINTLTWDDLSEVGKLSDVKAALKDLYADWRTPCWPMLEEFRVYGSMDVQTYVQSMVDNLRDWPRAV
ncbi:hypothetical protein BGZ52_004639 [Haplosporangium bisporale]|nr:hypothetical protein BGZ52_004639 [Haplosporangium bisporale]